MERALKIRRTVWHGELTTRHSEALNECSSQLFQLNGIYRGAQKWRPQQFRAATDEHRKQSIGYTGKDLPFWLYNTGLLFHCTLILVDLVWF